MYGPVPPVAPALHEVEVPPIARSLEFATNPVTASLNVTVQLMLVALTPPAAGRHENAVTVGAVVSTTWTYVLLLGPMAEPPEPNPL